MRSLPTASNLGRVFNCVGSEALPHSDTTSEFSALCTAGHAFIARAGEIGRDKALAEIDEHAAHRKLCEALPLDKLPQGGDHELALAWDYVTDAARELPADGHRDYSDAEPTEFVGTADYVGRGASWVVVVDWKMGYRYLGPARESRQLRILALAAARLTGLDEVRAAYCFLKDDGSYALSWATFNAFDLAEIADELRELSETLDDQRAEGSPLSLRQGEWCDFCPAYNHCPAKMKLARALGTDEEIESLARIERQIDAMTDEQLGGLYTKLDRYDDISTRLREITRKRAAQRPFDLPDGRRVGTVQWPFTVVNVAIAYPIVVARHGAAVAEKIFPRKGTVGALDELDEATLIEIEQRRGIVKGAKPQVRVHRP